MFHVDMLMDRGERGMERGGKGGSEREGETGKGGRARVRWVLSAVEKD